MIGFDAPLRCWGVWDQDLEDALGNPHHALILAHPDAELDGVPVVGSTGHLAEGGRNMNRLA